MYRMSDIVLLTITIAGVLGLPFERIVFFKYGAEFDISYIASLSLALYFITNIIIKGSWKFRIKKVNHIILFLFFFTGTTILSLFLNGYGFIEYFKSMVQLYVFVIPLLIYTTFRLDGRTVKVIINYLTVIIIITVIIELLYLLLGIRPPRVMGVDFVGMWEGELRYRLSGSFTEPSQLASLSSILLTYYLFQKKTKIHLIIIIGLLLIVLGSQSLSGIIIGTAGVTGWLIYNKKLSVNLIFSALVITIFTLVIINTTEFGNYIVSRIFKFKNSLIYVFNSGLELNSSFGVYRIVSNLLFLTLDSSDWILGLGFSGVDKIGFNSILASEKITSSLSFIIISSGYMGLMLFTYLFSRLYKYNTFSIFKVLFAIHLLTLMTSGSLLKSYFWWVIYLCIIGSSSNQFNSLTVNRGP